MKFAPSGSVIRRGWQRRIVNPLGAGGVGSKEILNRGGGRSEVYGVHWLKKGFSD
jgi:hypothetical protein